MLFRVRNGCERIVYITDNYNPYRVVNLDQLDDISDEGVVTDCNKLKLYKDHGIPCMTLFVGEGDTGVKDGTGQLEVGTYYFAFRYLDQEQNPTNWIFTSRPVAVADEQFFYTTSIETTNLYDGGSNVPNTPYYVPPTNKSIKLQLSQLDFGTFPYYQIAVVRRTGDAGEIAGVDVLFPSNIDSTTSTFIYSGFDSQIQYQTSVDEILSTIQRVDVVAAHAQVDNRLYIANTTNEQTDWSTFQRYVTKIKTR